MNTSAALRSQLQGPSCNQPEVHLLPTTIATIAFKLQLSMDVSYVTQSLGRGVRAGNCSSFQACSRMDKQTPMNYDITAIELM